jgi:carbon monoxide dehydrogenase subunit G
MTVAVVVAGMVRPQFSRSRSPGRSRAAANVTLGAATSAARGHNHRDPNRRFESMANMTGSSTAEIDAPRDRVWALVEDVESAPQWQGGLKSMHALERDGDGRAIFCETETDAKVRSVKAKVRFTYDGPGRLSWTQEQGDLKSVQGSWELEDLGGDRTRATYSIDVDLGRKLGMLVRGPVVDVLRHMLAGARAGELKKQVESG